MTENIHPASGQDEILPDGEAFTVEMLGAWVEPVPIQPGDFMVNVRLTTASARSFASLHLAAADLEFALQCLRMADERGRPTNSDIELKALISAGVITYARCFATGVRVEKLSADSLATLVTGFDADVHEYLMHLRNRHVAHSVNNFEEAESFGLLLRTANAAPRNGGAVGVTVKQSIGISKLLVRKAIDHICAVKGFVEADLVSRRQVVYAEFKEAFDRGDQFELAPLIKLTDRSSVSRPRIG